MNQLSNSVMSNLNIIWSQLALFAPQLFSAIVLLVFGYICAKLVAKVVKVALNKVGLDTVSERVGLSQLLASWKLSSKLSEFISKICFFFIFLIFLISTADVLELDGLSNTIDKLLHYLPNLIGAFIIFFVASIAGHFAKESILKMGDTLRINFSGALGNMAYYSILLIGLILAIGQLKIETAFLTHVIEIILVSTGVAMALSLGIGSREVSKNLISGVYLKESLREGAQVRVGEYEGELVAIKPVCFELRDKDGGSIILPNSRLLDCEIIQN